MCSRGLVSMELDDTKFLCPALERREEGKQGNDVALVSHILGVLGCWSRQKNGNDSVLVSLSLAVWASLKEAGRENEPLLIVIACASR